MAAKIQRNHHAELARQHGAGYSAEITVHGWQRNMGAWGLFLAEITVRNWQHKMAASYSAEITVHSWQSKLFLAEITVYNWQHKMAASYSAEIKVQSWQSYIWRLFLAEINIYSWQHKDGGWLFRKNPYKKLTVQDKGCYPSRNHHAQLTIQYGGFKSPCRADNAIQILTGSQYRGPPKVCYKISFENV